MRAVAGRPGAEPVGTSVRIFRLLKINLHYVRIPSLETRDKFPRHQLAEQDPVHFLAVQATAILPLAGPGIILDLLPKCLDAPGQLIQRHARLQVKRERHLAAVHQGLHTLTADLKPDRSLDSAISEVHIAELRLGLRAVKSHGKVDILQLRPFQSLAASSHRSLSMNMSLQVRLRPVDDLVTLWNKGGQRRKARSDIMPEELRPFVAVTCRAGSRIGKPPGRDDQFRAFKCLAISASDRESRQNVRHLPVSQQRHSVAQHNLNDGVKYIRGSV